MLGSRNSPQDFCRCLRVEPQLWALPLLPPLSPTLCGHPSVSSVPSSAPIKTLSHCWRCGGGGGRAERQGASSEQTKGPSVTSLLGDFHLYFPCRVPKSPASASHRLGASSPLCSPLCLSSHCALSRASSLCEGATQLPRLLPVSL